MIAIKTLKATLRQREERKKQLGKLIATAEKMIELAVAVRKVTDELIESTYNQYNRRTYSDKDSPFKRRENDEEKIKDCIQGGR